MKSLPRLFASAIAAACALLLAGCLLDHAPTGPWRSNNTWLLGVWETTDEKDHTLRAIVTPKDSSHMRVYFTEKNKAGKTVRSSEHDAWISRVGLLSLLVVEVPQEDATRYLALGYQFLDPLKVRIREVTLDPSKPLASSFRVRVQIRRQFKRGDLFGGKSLLWNKVAEVYWEKTGDPETHTFRPVRNLPSSPAPFPGAQTP